MRGGPKAFLGWEGWVAKACLGGEGTSAKTSLCRGKGKGHYTNCVHTLTVNPHIRMADKTLDKGDTDTQDREPPYSDDKQTHI